MNTIQILDPIVAQQIAAGEVVDRPASVVKELVENSLDAGAGRVEIVISEGGASKILIHDDGRGMDREDAARSILRHATSKIQEAQDIETVSTHGFRGEALPSIASVSLLELTTSTADDSAGTKITVDGGAEGLVEASSHPRGTTVLVNMLFYNVPARRAFLKGKRTERAAIVNVTEHLAVAHPEVAFKLREDNKDLLSYTQARDGRERLAQVYGAGKARGMKHVSLTSGAYEVKGFVALPSLTFSNRNACQTVSINGRWVASESVSRGIDDGYRGTLPAGRYAPVALTIDVDPRQVDVNVHPTKQIVRFSDEKGVRQAVADTIKVGLGYGGAPSSSSSGGAPSTDAHSQQGATTTDQDTAIEAGRAPERPSRGIRPNNSGGPKNPLPQDQSSSRGGSDSVKRRQEQAANIPQTQERIRAASKPASQNGGGPQTGLPGDSSTGEVDRPEPPERGSLPDLADLRVIGQAGLGYILAEEPGVVWVIDQHVAHERVILDRLKDSETPPTVQPLLVPTVVELSEEETALLSEALEELAVYGFEAEMFGPRSVRVTSVISTLADRDIAEAFSQAVRVIAGTEAGMTREERLLATVACHSAVKLGDRLTVAEMEILVRDWLTSRQPATCPHGRSICYSMTVRDMGRKLDRH